MTMHLTLHAFDLPLRHTFTISRESITSQPTLVVELSEGGVSGYGEATSNKYYGFTIDRMAQFFPAAQFRKTLYKPQVIKLLMRTGSVDRALELVGTEKTIVSEVLPPTVIITTPDRAKVERAVKLSRETYCSVMHTLRPDLDLLLEVHLD